MRKVAAFTLIVLFACGGAEARGHQGDYYTNAAARCTASDAPW